MHEEKPVYSRSGKLVQIEPKFNDYFYGIWGNLEGYSVLNQLENIVISEKLYSIGEKVVCQQDII